MIKQSVSGHGSTCLAALLLVASILHGRAQTTTIVDNLANPDDGNLTVLSTVHWANNFGTDAMAYTLDEVHVSLDLPGDTSSDLVVELWSDDASLPGSSLAALSTVANPETAGTFVFTPAGSVTLEANTSYWVVLSVASGAGEYDWNSTLTLSHGGVGTLGGLASFFGGSWVASPATDRAILAVTGGPIPEPSTLALICAGGLMAGLFIRRRKH